MKGKLILAGLTAAAMGVVGAGSAEAKPATDTSSKEVYADCVDMLGQRHGTFTWVGPTASWPPNHKDKSALITLAEDDDVDPADEVSLEVVGIHDEATYEDNIATGEDNGTGNTDPVTDARGGADTGAGSASVPVFWRAERSGRGDGRTYTFTATGTTDNGLGNCEAKNFFVAVPHDQSGKDRTAARKSRKSARRARR